MKCLSDRIKEISKENENLKSENKALRQQLEEQSDALIDGYMQQQNNETAILSNYELAQENSSAILELFELTGGGEGSETISNQ